MFLQPVRGRLIINQVLGLLIVVQVPQNSLFSDMCIQLIYGMSPSTVVAHPSAINQVRRLSKTASEPFRRVVCKTSNHWLWSRHSFCAAPSALTAPACHVGFVYNTGKLPGLTVTATMNCFPLEPETGQENSPLLLSAAAISRRKAGLGYVRLSGITGIDGTSKTSSHSGLLLRRHMYFPIQKRVCCRNMPSEVAILSGTPFFSRDIPIL
jgi:hypothetical protein